MIKEFRVNILDENIDELKSKIKNTR